MRFHRFVVMGVCGCGKTTVGQALAQALDCQFVEGDSLHPAANIDAMSRGVPLTDDMRRPWLTRIADELSTAQTGLVVSCSALKIAYRDILPGGGTGVFCASHFEFRHRLCPCGAATRSLYACILGQKPILHPAKPWGC